MSYGLLPGSKACSAGAGVPGCWAYLDEMQHCEGEVLVAEAAVHHHLHEGQQ